MKLLTHEDLIAEKLLPWLQASNCLCRLAPVCCAFSRATRRHFDVQIAPGEDIRYVLSNGMVPDFGTLRIPSEGVLLTGALHEPLSRGKNLRIAALRGAKAPAPVELPIDSMYGTVEFYCKRLCLDGLHFRSEPAASHQVPSDQVPSDLVPYHIHVEEAVLLCRHCHFNAQLTLLPLKTPVGSKMTIMSTLERCIWKSSHIQGLVVTGRPTTNFSAAEEVAKPSQSDVNVIHSLSGNLRNSTPLVVANGRRTCAVKECGFWDVRHHALLARWDVYVIVEHCEVHGRVHIEDGPEVVLRCNPYLEIHGNRLAPGFTGLFSNGYLEELPPERMLRRQNSKSKSPLRRRSTSKETIVGEESRAKGKRNSDSKQPSESSRPVERWRALGVAHGVSVARGVRQSQSRAR